MNRIEDKITNSSPVPHGTGVGTGEKQEAVKVAKKPRAYVGEYLDLHPEIEAQIGQPYGVGYRDLEVMISEYAGIKVPRSTIHREVKNRECTNSD